MCPFVPPHCLGPRSPDLYRDPETRTAWANPATGDASILCSLCPVLEHEAVAARFDDLRSTPASAFRLARARGVVEARTPEEVPAALAEVERAVASGLWAGGFVSYEAAPGLDRALAVRSPATDGPPLVWFGLFERREAARPLEASPVLERAAPPDWAPSIDVPRYAADVQAIRGLIAEGETYQVNHTFRLRAPLAGDDRSLYRALCLAQRGAHCAYVAAGRWRVLSASPELFFAIEGERIVSRPMKGTARRGRWAAEDEACAAGLRESAKDRAENAMIVDLIRNDLGRVAVAGSVEVPRRFEIERYETIWQMTSTVEATLRRGTPLVEVFRALFPCGSVTGAPKARAMRAIADLESSPRGIYTGAVGVLAPPGAAGPRAAFNVAIRTVVADARERVAEYGVGGGITFDSSAQGEYEECRAKALVLRSRRPAFELLETLRREPDGTYRLLEAHLGRLEGSATYFGFAFDDAAVRRALAALPVGNHPQRVRLTLSRDGRVGVWATRAPAPSPRPVRLAIDGDPLDHADPLLFHKTTLREPYTSRAARHPGADDVVLVNGPGEVTETTIANLAVRLDDRWWTPPLEVGCLPGVMRGHLLAEGTLAERRLLVADLLRADAVAVVNSLRGWRDAVVARCAAGAG